MLESSSSSSSQKLGLVSAIALLGLGWSMDYPWLIIPGIFGTVIFIFSLFQSRLLTPLRRDQNLGRPILEGQGINAIIAALAGEQARKTIPNLLGR